MAKNQGIFAKDGNTTITLNILIGIAVLIIEPFIPFPNFILERWVALTIGAALFVGYVAIVLATSKSLPKEKQGVEFIATGMYSVVRHPLYAGIMLFFNTAIVFLFQSYLYAIALPILWLLWIQQIKKEEEQNEKIFGELYKQYQKNIPMIVPFTRPKQQ